MTLNIIPLLYDLWLNVRKSWKKNMLPWILPKNKCWGNFMYSKLPQRSFFGRIQDTIICFWDLLTFSRWSNAQNSWLVGDCIQHRRNGCIYMYNRMTCTNNAKLKEFKWQYVGQCKNNLLRPFWLALVFALHGLHIFIWILCTLHYLSKSFFVHVDATIDSGA